MPDDDVAADRYEQIDDRLTAAGFDWYEVSNWAKPQGQCRHNIAYWRNAAWWGIGPGAHSHLEGRRWWNVKHPHTYAQRLGADLSPVQDEEVLTPEQRALENLMLGMRMKQGISRADLVCGDQAIDELLSQQLIEQDVIDRQETLVLSRRGRLLADYVIRRLAA
jgi:oxygen-independent coproporphyrinogen-3 oxidase